MFCSRLFLFLCILEMRQPKCKRLVNPHRMRSQTSRLRMLESQVACELGHMASMYLKPESSNTGSDIDAARYG